jgi:hypothetical protein
MFRKQKDQKSQAAKEPLVDSQADNTGEKLNGFKTPTALDADAVAEAAQGEGKTNAEKGDDIDHFLKVTGKMLNGPPPRYTDEEVHCRGCNLLASTGDSTNLKQTLLTKVLARPQLRFCLIK